MPPRARTALQLLDADDIRDEIRAIDPDLRPDFSLLRSLRFPPGVTLRHLSVDVDDARTHVAVLVKVNEEADILGPDLTAVFEHAYVLLPVAYFRADTPRFTTPITVDRLEAEDPAARPSLEELLFEVAHAPGYRAYA